MKASEQLAIAAYIMASIPVLIATIASIIFYLRESDQDYLKGSALGTIVFSFLIYSAFDFKKTCEAKNKEKTKADQVRSKPTQGKLNQTMKEHLDNPQSTKQMRSNQSLLDNA